MRRSLHAEFRPRLCIFASLSLLSDTSATSPPKLQLSNGVSYPVLGLGSSKGVKHDAVVAALEFGYRLIDTAQAEFYAYREDEVGSAVAGSGLPRGEVFLQTKISPTALGYENTRSSFNKSLRNLQTKYIDSLLIHKPSCSGRGLPEEYCIGAGTWQDSWRALEDLYDEGLVRAIGMCDVSLDIFQELMQQRVKPHVIQNWMDPFHQDRQIRDLSTKHGVLYQAYSSTGPQWMEQRHYKENPVVRDSTLQLMALGHGRSVVQVLLRWATQQGVAVIPASRKRARLAENLASLDFNLTSAEMRKIDSMDGKDLPQEASPAAFVLSFAVVMRTYTDVLVLVNSVCFVGGIRCFGSANTGRALLSAVSATLVNMLMFVSSSCGYVAAFYCFDSLNAMSFALARLNAVVHGGDSSVRGGDLSSGGLTRVMLLLGPTILAVLHQILRGASCRYYFTLIPLAGLGSFSAVALETAHHRHMGR
eukprot:gnl/TRDRNA2_/TRDRNA2_133697_c0_seq2.p1 gnl/TRDRNA2_/TRDRNA2_133697_c0~~gnl/TRDRNA2_/TRDRNA2_133697_c0_seq2.p1  ORF type:complete len:476 (+),score=63.18 gnl/TRDRNA2_/TRDRNA2_133697_c0_seq2:77-1504(+)